MPASYPTWARPTRSRPPTRTASAPRKDRAGYNPPSLLAGSTRTADPALPGTGPPGRQRTCGESASFPSLPASVLNTTMTCPRPSPHNCRSSAGIRRLEGPVVVDRNRAGRNLDSFARALPPHENVNTRTRGESGAGRQHSQAVLACDGEFGTRSESGLKLKSCSKPEIPNEQPGHAHSCLRQRLSIPGADLLGDIRSDGIVA